MMYPQNIEDFITLASINGYNSAYILFVPPSQLNSIDNFDFIEEAGIYSGKQLLFAISGFMLEELYNMENSKKFEIPQNIGYMTHFKEESNPISFKNGYVLDKQLDQKIRAELYTKIGFKAKVERTSMLSITQEGKIEVLIKNKSIDTEYLKLLMQLFSNDDISYLSLFKTKIDNTTNNLRSNKRLNKAIDDFLESFSKKSGENIADTLNELLKKLFGGL